MLLYQKVNKGVRIDIFLVIARNRLEKKKSRQEKAIILIMIDNLIKNDQKNSSHLEALILLDNIKLIIVGCGDFTFILK